MVFVFETQKLREAFEAWCAAQGIDAERMEAEHRRLMAFLTSAQARAAKLWMDAPGEKQL